MSEHDGSQPANLMFWKDVLLTYVQSGQPDLTNRQMTVLMMIYASDELHTVGSLTTRLALSGPVVSRSIDTLVALGYLQRRPDPGDRRSTRMTQTPSGAAFLKYLERTITRTSRAETLD